MIYNKLNESIIQDEDNIGNDLEAIENEIFNDEEDNIVEETFTAIYEMEYNSNILLKNIGLMQLSEAVDGEDKKENILVRAWKAVKKFFINLWDGIKKLWSKLLDKLGVRDKFYKSFLKNIKKKKKENNDADSSKVIKINEGYFRRPGDGKYGTLLNDAVREINYSNALSDISKFGTLLLDIVKKKTIKIDGSVDDKKERVMFLKLSIINHEFQQQFKRQFEDLDVTALGEALKNNILSLKGSEIEIELTDENVKKYKEIAEENLEESDDYIKTLKWKIKEIDGIFESSIKSFNEIEPKLQELNIDKDGQAYLTQYTKRLQWEIKSLTYLSSIVISTATSEFEAARYQSKKLLEAIWIYL